MEGYELTFWDVSERMLKEGSVQLKNMWKIAWRIKSLAQFMMKSRVRIKELSTRKCNNHGKDEIYLPRMQENLVTSLGNLKIWWRKLERKVVFDP